MTSRNAAEPDEPLPLQPPADPAEVFTPVDGEKRVPAAAARGGRVHDGQGDSQAGDHPEGYPRSKEELSQADRHPVLTASPTA